MIADNCADCPCFLIALRVEAICREAGIKIEDVNANTVHAQNDKAEVDSRASS